MARCLQEAVKVNSGGRYRVVLLLVAVVGEVCCTERFRGHSEVLETENQTMFDH